MTYALIIARLVEFHDAGWRYWRFRRVWWLPLNAVGVIPTRAFTSSVPDDYPFHKRWIGPAYSHAGGAA